MTRILDCILTALLAAAIVMFALAVWQPWDADVTEAVAVHAAEPLDVNDSIIVRWETADGTEVLPPKQVPLWQYVQVPQLETASRLSGLETALEHDIHQWRVGCGLMHTHDFIDGHAHVHNGDGGQ